VMSLVLSGNRTQVEAAQLLKRSVRQVRRIQRRLEGRVERFNATAQDRLVKELRLAGANECDNFSWQEKSRSHTVRRPLFKNPLDYHDQ